MQTLYIYKITNKLDGRNYIGQRHCPVGLTPWTDSDYMGSGPHIRASEKKWGIENFSKEIIAVCYNQEILDILEYEYIKMYKEMGKAEYNHRDGGCTFMMNGKPWNYGVPISEETKQKIIKTKMENPIPKEIRDAITKKVKSYYNDECYRKAHSEKIKNKQFYDSISKPEYKQKISESSKKMWSDPEKKKEIGKIISERTKGIKKSEQAKTNIGNSMRNSVKFHEVMASEEHKLKLSKSISNSKKHYESHHSEEFKNKMREIAKNRSPKQIEQGKRFSKCCLGRKRYTNNDGKHVLEFPEKAPVNWVKGWI